MGRNYFDYDSYLKHSNHLWLQKMHFYSNHTAYGSVESAGSNPRITDWSQSAESAVRITDCKPCPDSRQEPLEGRSKILGAVNAHDTEGNFLGAS